ncbi:MAG: phage tail assembly chaperone [Butyricicoccus sp.]
MGNLTAFLAQNAKQVENVKLVVSDRFTDEDGKPLEWEVRCISSREDETLRRDCQYRVQVPGKRGSFRQEFDNVLYLAKLAAACTVYPNLNDAELQDSYGVKCAEELISAMLTPGEYTNYTEKLFDICGFGDKLDLVEQAKTDSGRDDEASVAHFCLQELHILPSAFLSLPTEESIYHSFVHCARRGRGKGAE